MTAIACLPMYDWPEIRSSWDCLWSATRNQLRARNVETPDRLIHIEDYQPIWTDPDLLLGQTCGWPFVSGLQEQVTAFARFDVGLPGLKPGDYQSVYLARNARQIENLSEIGNWIRNEKPRIAINNANSQSGCRVLGECFDIPYEVGVDQFVFSGSHRNSIRMLASGEADLCAVDAVSWRYALAHEPAAQQVHVVGR
ncbi:MAG: phosphate/phosphite/phosphonate ABC transporter substrate-binding protein, partial [Rhizobiaceae bacterium]